MDDNVWIAITVFTGLAAMVFLRLLATERESVVLLAEIEAVEAKLAEEARKAREAKMEANLVKQVSDVEVV